MADWNHLPLELRWIIVDYIRTFTSRWPTDDPPCPELPLVSREWYGYFAHEAFRVVVLDQDRLSNFKRLVSNNTVRQANVHRIVLRIRLLEYDCTVCQTPEDTTTARLNDFVFIQTLQKFMDIMSSWRKAQSRKEEIELDIGVYSPSDRKHGFQGAYDHYATDMCPEWERTLRGTRCVAGWRERLLSTVGDPQAPHFGEVFANQRTRHGRRQPIIFPPAPVFEHLLIKRQYHRHISPDILRRLITQGLPNLKRFHHEPWAYPDLLSQRRFQQDYFTVIDALPATVQEIHLLTEFNAIMPLHKLADSRLQWLRVDPLEALMGTVLTTIAMRLKRLSAPFFVEAEHFFEKSLSDRLQYPSLEYLSLTSRLLSPSKSAELLQLLSVIAAAATIAAKQMPKLKSLDIWYGENSDAFLIRFKKGDAGQLVLIWYCTRYTRDHLTLFQALHGGWQSVEPSIPLHIMRSTFKDSHEGQWHWKSCPELAMNMPHPHSSSWL